MSTLLIRGGQLVRKYAIHKGDLLISGSRIERIGTDLPSAGCTVIEADGLYVTPGFINIHIHGGGGCDFMDGTTKAVTTILDTSLAHGTTCLLATIGTAPISQMRKAMEAIGAVEDERIAGVYVEGPFFSEEKKGSQPARYLLQPTIETYEALTEGFKEHIKIFALAPELPGAAELMPRLLKDLITPSLGHSNATYKQTMEAIEAGLTHFTHFYNGMSGLHHRDPGAVGAGLQTPTTTLEVIADGVHVHPSAISLMVRAKGIDHICLITDAIRAMGLGDGEYTVGGQKAIVKDGIARLVDGGSLAGSTLTMDRAVRNMVEFGVPLVDAVRAASLVPAKILGIEQKKGSIAVGKDADLVLLDEDFAVRAVLVKGDLRHRSEQN